MLKRLVWVAPLVVAATALLTAQDAKTVIANVSKAMGAENVMSVTYSGTAADVNFIQTRNINGPWPLRPITGYVRAIDLSQVSSRASGATNNQGLFGGAPVAGQFTQAINANSAAWAAANTSQLEYWITPWGFLKGAAANNATLKTQKVNGRNYTVLTWSPPAKAPSGISYTVNGYVNAQNMIERVETWVDHPMYGDMHVDTAYSDYKDFGGLKMPTHIVQKRGGFTFFEVNVMDAKANPANLTELLTAPPRGGGPGGGAPGGGAPGRGGAAGAAPGAAPGGARAGGGAPGGAPGGPGGGPGGGGARGGGAPAAPAPASTKLADGVYLLTGAYQSLAIDFTTYVVVVEAGDSVARGDAIVAETKKLFPDKPIRYVVNSHPHSDHSSGLAPLVAEGATIVTYKNNKKFFEEIFSAPRTLLGDSLDKAKRKPKVEGIGEKFVIKDDKHSLELYHIIDTDIEKVHSDGIIIAFLPKEKILFQADFTPPVPPAMANPFVQSLSAWLAKNKLDFDQYIPVHRADPMTRQTFMQVVGINY